MKFKNRPNIPRTLDNGDILWESRSCAVTCIVSARVDGIVYLALNKRGPGTPDFQGYWSLFCGYVDWDENIYDAARREIWEEGGLNLERLGFRCKGTAHENQPWFVSSNPDSSVNQNIVFRFWFDGPQNLKELPKLTADHCEPGEVDDLCWFKLDDIADLKLAFDQNAAISFWKEQYLATSF
jgi:8-oxo-dGTP pyrophosphatase MutT (NUDIX family)